VSISHDRSTDQPYTVFVFFLSEFITRKAAVPFPYLSFFHTEMPEIHVHKISNFSPYLTAQLVDAMSYKPDDRVSIPHGVIKFFIDIILPAALWSWG
jgi:hypothetical protein